MSWCEDGQWTAIRRRKRSRNTKNIHHTHHNRQGVKLWIEVRFNHYLSFSPSWSYQIFVICLNWHNFWLNFLHANCVNRNNNKNAKNSIDRNKTDFATKKNSANRNKTLLIIICMTWHDMTDFLDISIVENVSTLQSVKLLPWYPWQMSGMMVTKL